MLYSLLVGVLELGIVVTVELVVEHLVPVARDLQVVKAVVLVQAERKVYLRQGIRSQDLHYLVARVVMLVAQAQVPEDLDFKDQVLYMCVAGIANDVNSSAFREQTWSTCRSAMGSARRTGSW